MKMKRRKFPPAVLFLAAISVFAFCACGGKKKAVDVTKEKKQTIAQESTRAEWEPDANISEAPGTGEKSSEGKDEKHSKEPIQTIKTLIDRYRKNSITVEYPVVSGMKDSEAQDKLNAHLKKNALAILENYPDSGEPVNQERDTLNIRCEVISADASRIVAIYKGDYFMDGAAHPNNLFYSNTVSVKTLKDVQLKDVADPHTMASYALSEDVTLKDMNPELLSAYLEWNKTTEQEQYRKCLEQADFPLKKGTDGKTVTWPDSFSYESEGALFFSIPVPHAMGDYLIVEYDMTTK